MEEVSQGVPPFAGHAQRWARRSHRPPHVPQEQRPCTTLFGPGVPI